MLIHYSLLVFHALSFVQGLSRVIETGLRATNFAKTIQGKKLTGNVIKEVAVTSVLNCQIECAKESRCLSYNFKATTSKAPSTCYLSDSDRFRSLTNFSKDEEVLYGGIQVFLFKHVSAIAKWKLKLTRIQLQLPIRWRLHLSKSVSESGTF